SSLHKCTSLTITGQASTWFEKIVWRIVDVPVLHSPTGPCMSGPHEFGAAPERGSCQTASAKRTTSMAYRIRRKERGGKGIRRILGEQLGRAVEAARDRDGAQEERVHDVRTRLKRSRAALELIGAEIGESAKKTDRRLRNRGRRLARPRDMIVQAHTFRILGARMSTELPAGLLERMRDVGEQLRSKLDEKSVEKELRRTARSLRRVRKRLKTLPVKRGKRA